MEGLLEWFSQELLPEVVAAGRFHAGGSDADALGVEGCEFEAPATPDHGFASSPVFAKLTLKTLSGSRRLDVLIKFQLQDPLLRRELKTVPQCKNEVTVYTRVLPGFAHFLQHCGYEGNLVENLVPRCHFAFHDPENPEKSLLVLEDLRGGGYRMTESLVDLDLDHCLISVEKLARFHSVSFAMKFRNWKPLEKLRDCFDSPWTTDDPSMRQDEDLHRLTVSRGIDYLLSKKDSEVPREYLENFKKLLNPLLDFLLSLVAPREPLAVVCHGDFNRNNVLFRYVRGAVADARLIDFQRSVYGSPCLDLSFFVYMHTSLELRERHFDDLLARYHSALVATTAAILKEDTGLVDERLPLEAIREEFGRVAARAYATVSFFLPIMRTPHPERLVGKTPREVGELLATAGGEAVSRFLADIVVDFYRRKFYMP